MSVSIGTPAQGLDGVQACHQIPSQVDVLVLTQSPLMPDLQAQDRAALRDLTANLNDRHRNAQFAGRASAELHTLIFFSKQAIAADARIVKVFSILLCYPAAGSHHGAVTPCWSRSMTRRPPLSNAVCSMQSSILGSTQCCRIGVVSRQC